MQLRQSASPEPVGGQGDASVGCCCSSSTSATGSGRQKRRGTTATAFAKPHGRYNIAQLPRGRGTPALAARCRRRRCPSPLPSRAAAQMGQCWLHLCLRRLTWHRAPSTGHTALPRRRRPGHHCCDTLGGCIGRRHRGMRQHSHRADAVPDLACASQSVWRKRRHKPHSAGQLRRSRRCKRSWLAPCVPRSHCSHSGPDRQQTAPRSSARRSRLRRWRHRRQERREWQRAQSCTMPWPTTWPTPPAGPPSSPLVAAVLAQRPAYAMPPGSQKWTELIKDKST